MWSQTPTKRSGIRAPKFDPDKGNFRMFAAGLVRSVIRDLAHKGVRNLRLRPWNYQEDSTEDVIGRFHDESTEPLRRIVIDETSKAIDDALTDALMKLPRQQRVAWILGEIEGYKNPHITGVIKVKHPTTVSVYKHKATKSLKRYLSDWGDPYLTLLSAGSLRVCVPFFMTTTYRMRA